MINFGPVPLGAVLPVFFSSYAGSTGASITLTGLAVTDIEIYKGTSMTQRASDAGYTLLDTDGIDVDSTTGIHAFSIDTGDNTDSGFFAAGSFYTVIVSAVTVDSQTVNFIAATFRIVPAESSSGVAKVDVTHFGGTAGTFSSGRPEVNTTHAAGTAWGSGAITAASIAADAITAAKIADGAIDAATFAAGAIDAAAIATDAITSAELAATATAEIATAVRTELATELARIDVATSTRLASASYSAPPSAATIAGAVWDEAISGHLTAGTTGAKLNAAASAGDPWSTALPGAYSAGSAGFLVGTYLDAAISTRLATSGYTAPLSAAGTRTALGLASANLDTQLDALPTATENADALLNRDMSAVSDTNSRSPLNALRHIRNKWSVSGTTLTVTKEDDTTSAWTSTLSTNASADPITGSDPA